MNLSLIKISEQVATLSFFKPIISRWKHRSIIDSLYSFKSLAIIVIFVYTDHYYLTIWLPRSIDTAKSAKQII